MLRRNHLNGSTGQSPRGLIPVPSGVSSGGAALPHMLPKFETNAVATLQRVQSTFGLRGTEYGDTMKNCQWLTMKTIARRYGVDIPPDLYRALAVGGLCDLKYQRQEGGYKDDNFVDSIAYQAFLAQDILDLDAARQLATQHIKSNGTPLARKSS